LPTHKPPIERKDWKRNFIARYLSHSHLMKISAFPPIIFPQIKFIC
jgi:hypothetical protein